MGTLEDNVDTVRAQTRQGHARLSIELQAMETPKRSWTQRMEQAPSWPACRAQSPSCMAR